MGDHYLFGRFESRAEPLTPDDVEGIVAEARAAQRALEEAPLSTLLDTLDAVARRWRDPAYPGRRQALQHMPAVVGFSEPMVAAALDALCDVLARPAMEQKIQLELGGREALDGWRWIPAYAGYARAQALGVVLHVSAGNVFVSGADSLVHGLVTRNASILKVSRADPLFPLLFARSLQEVGVGGALAVLEFRGGERELEDAFKRTVDGIVVWGGAEAVQAWRRDLPLGTRLLGYGPKVSLAVLTAQGILSGALEDIGRAVARDVVLWEQRACSSPQVVYLEEAEEGELLTDLFVDELARALERMREELPPAALGMDEKIEILRHRELARMAEAFGEGQLLAPDRSQAWTIIRESTRQGG